MTERVRFLGDEKFIEVRLLDEHPGEGDFDHKVFKERLPVVAFESEDGNSLPEILARVGEHVFSCPDCHRVVEENKSFHY